MGEGECHLFLTGNRAVLLGNQSFSWQEIATVTEVNMTSLGTVWVLL